MATIHSREQYITQDLSVIEKALGVDLKLSKDGDIEVSNLKDLKLVSGAENAAQALRLKLEIEPGSLIWHPDLGTNLLIGNKSIDAFQLKLQVTKSIIKDPRFDKVDVKVNVLGSIIVLDIRVILAGTSTWIPLQLATER